MLNRSSRLTTRLFNEAMKTGKVVHSTFFVARILLGAPDLRLAAVAPVKIAKTAALRNKTRRRIYGAARPVIAGTSAGARIILIAKPALLASKDAAAIQDDIRSIFVKAGLLR